MSAAIIRILWESQGGERLGDCQLMEISSSGNDAYQGLGRVAEMMRSAGQDSAPETLRGLADVVEMYGETARIAHYASVIRANRAMEKADRKTPKPVKVEPSEHLH